ncbi:MAG: coproporphyrinogen III oxidase, partial [Polycyclovorans sp.]|nr:coproporphyrinogen III oxidase [Polycyclovorans sp.]
KAQAAISPTDQADEYLMMGLRLRSGIDLDRHAALAGKPLAKERLNELRDLGMIETDTRHLRATAKGRPVLNAIIRALIGD